MSAPPKILAFAGSLRRDSYNKKLVRVAAAAASGVGAEVTVIDLRDFALPIYDGDDEAAHGLPEGAKKLKQIMKEHDGLLIASPEYNSSLTGALKNAIDWASRPEPDEPPLAAFAGKVAALLATSPGALGGLRGLVHLRAILGNIKVLVIPDQLAVPKAGDLFDDRGNLTDEATRKKVEDVAVKLAHTLARLKD